MLEFISDDIRIAINQNVNLKLNSPLFITDMLKGTFSFPFTLPLSDSLKQTLNHPDRITSMRCKTGIKGKLLAKGVSFSNCSLKISNANNKEINIKIASSASRFASLTKDLNLSSLNLGQLNFTSEANLITFLNNSARSDSSTCDIALPTLYNDKIIEVDEDTGIHPIYSEKWPWINPVTQMFYEYDLTYLGKRNFICPMLYMPNLLQKIFESFGYQLIDKVFGNNAELSKMIYFSLYNLADQDNDYNIYFNKLMPNKPLSSFLIDVQNLLAAKFIFKENSNEVSFVFLNNCITSIKNPLLIKHDTPYIHHDKGFDSISIEQKKAKDDYIYWKEFYIQDKNNFRPAVENESDLPTDNLKIWQLCLVLKTNDIYMVLNNLGDLIWTKTVPAGENYRFPFEEFKFQGINPLKFKTNISTFSENFDCDTPHQILFTNVSLDEWLNSEADHRFLFKGESHHYDDDNSEIPNLYFAMGCTNVISNYNWFYIRDRHNVIEFWRPFNHFLSKAKYTETKIIITSKQLSNWDWLQPIKIGETHVLANTLDVTLTNANNYIAKLTAYTL